MCLAEKCRQASLRGRTVTVDIVSGVAPNYKLKQRWPECLIERTRVDNHGVRTRVGLAGAMEHSP